MNTKISMAVLAASPMLFSESRLVKSFLKYTLLIPLFTFAPIAAAWAVQLEWEVVNRFPLFQKAEHFEALKNIWAKSGSAAETVDSKEFTMKLREALPIRKTAWEPKKGLYNKKTLFPATHEIKVWLQDVPVGTACTWLVNSRSEEPANCTEGIRVAVESGKPFSIVAMPDGYDSVMVSVPAIKERLIVSLGDSFASGEGNPDHPTEFNPGAVPHHLWYIEANAAKHIRRGAEWWDEACHRSLLSWPALAAMSRAIANPHEVVQFASFACSGAEIYDGILRAQVNPPGLHATYLKKPGLFKRRDGGPGYKNENGELVSGQTYKRLLPLSQQHALADLLCVESPPTKMKKMAAPSVQYGIRRDQNYFGEVDLYGCKGKKRVIDQLLLSVGGNDVAFSGIVAWLITPKSGRTKIGEFFLNLGRREMQVVEPGQAKEAGFQHLPKLYDVLSDVLKKLEIDPNKVVLLQYPDPTENAGDLAQCNQRTRDGNAAMQGLVKKKLHNENFLFGINKPEFQRLDKEYVAPLREIQAKASKSLKWKLVDSQEAITYDGTKSRSYCGVAQCSGETCSTGDKVRWWARPRGYSEAPKLKMLNEFEAYDGTRVRGFRYGNDALLAAVAPAGSTKEIRDDWLAGSAHPTANIHARIADIVVNLQEPSRVAVREHGQVRSRPCKIHPTPPPATSSESPAAG